MSEHKGNSGVGYYLSKFILMMIPLINFVMGLIWAFTGRDDDEKSFGRALLLFLLLIVILSVMLGAAGIAIIYRLINQFALT